MEKLTPTRKIICFECKGNGFIYGDFFEVKQCNRSGKEVQKVISDDKDEWEEKIDDSWYAVRLKEWGLKQYITFMNIVSHIV